MTDRALVETIGAALIAAALVAVVGVAWLRRWGRVP